MRKFKYSAGDVVGNLEIKGLGGTSKSGTRLYSVLCLLCGSVTDKRLQTIEGAKSCGCMQSKRDRKVVGSGRRTEDEINAKAEALAKQHQQDILDARANLVREAVEKGYNLSEWKICDNLVDIQAGNTLDYRCWLSKSNPVAF